MFIFKTERKPLHVLVNHSELKTILQAILDKKATLSSYCKSAENSIYKYNLLDLVCVSLESGGFTMGIKISLRLKNDVEEGSS